MNQTTSHGEPPIWPRLISNRHARATQRLWKGPGAPIGRSAVRALTNSSGKNEARFTNQAKPWPPQSHRRASACVVGRWHHLTQTLWLFRSKWRCGRKRKVFRQMRENFSGRRSQLRRRRMGKPPIRQYDAVGTVVELVTSTRRMSVRNDGYFSRRRPEL